MGQVHDEGRSRGEGTRETRATRLRSHSFYLEGRPHPKERPRVTKTGHAFTPEKTRKAEQRIRELYDGPKYSGEIAVHLVFDHEGTAVIIEGVDVDGKSKLRGDIDNYIKTVLDALNGVAWGDDNQIVKVTAVKI